MPRPIDGPTLKSLLEAGEPLQLVDARGCPSYNISHIPGAVELIRRVAEKRAPKLLDRGRPVVVYSADDKSPASGLLARRLEDLGFYPVYDYNDSFADWAGRGYPVDVVGA